MLQLSKGNPTLLTLKVHIYRNLLGRQWKHENNLTECASVAIATLVLLDDLDIDILQLGLYEVHIIFGVGEVISFGLRQSHPVLEFPFTRTGGRHRTFPPVWKEAL